MLGRFVLDSSIGHRLEIRVVRHIASFGPAKKVIGNSWSPWCCGLSWAGLGRLSETRALNSGPGPKHQQDSHLELIGL